jgi:tight adherence protein C
MGIEVYAAALAIIGAVFLVIYGVFGADKLTSLTEGRGHSMPIRAATLRDMRLQTAATDRILGPIVSGLAGKARRLTPLGAIDEMERKISVSGLASTWTVERLLGTKIATGGLGAVIGGYLVVSNPTPKMMVVCLILAAGAYILPDMSLDRRAKDRAKVIEKQLPDLLDQMTIGVEAGLGFDAALMRVARENDGPVAEEFGRMMQDRQLGMSREEAFKKVVDRTLSADLKHFILALTQADKHGMPLATVLRVQADEMRQKRRVRAEEKALSLPVKLVLPLVLCILPALFTVIIGPAAFRLTKGGLAG